MKRFKRRGLFPVIFPLLILLLLPFILCIAQETRTITGQVFVINEESLWINEKEYPLARGIRIFSEDTGEEQGLNSFTGMGQIQKARIHIDSKGEVVRIDVLEVQQ